jgi:hypothetical protein
MITNQAGSPCAECQYDYAPLDHCEIIAAVTSLADKHRQVLASVPRWELSQRSNPATWSPLEYSCHVRDVLLVQRERVMAAQAQDRPEFEPMRRDERAIEERYNEQDPLAVAVDITTAAGLLADELTALDEQGWRRAGIYPWPAPQTRTVEWVTKWTAHELAHHLFDIHRLIGSPGPCPNR